MVGDMVSFTDLVFSENIREKIKFRTSRDNSSTIPASWMVPGPRGMILGPGGVMGGSMIGQEDSYDLRPLRVMRGAQEASRAPH